MSRDEAFNLAKRIRREAWHQVKTKVGQVNGQSIVHMIDTEAHDKREASVNINNLGDWIVHPLNKLNRAKEVEHEGVENLIITDVTGGQDA